MQFVVIFQETLNHEVIVEAESETEALHKAEERFGDDEFDTVVSDDLMVADIQAL
jgi:hypothetical protein